MLVFLCIIKLVFCEIVTVRILYEKEVEKVVHSIHSWVMEEIVKKYNEYLQGVNIFVKLDKLSPLSLYDTTEEELELDALAGSDNMKDRRRVVRKINKGVILISSTSKYFKDTIINGHSPCNVKLITTYLKNGNLKDDTLTKFISAYQTWLEKVLRAHVPDIFVEGGKKKMETLVSNLKQSNYITEIIKCNNMNGDEKTHTNSEGDETAVSGQLEEIKKLLIHLTEQKNKDKEKTDQGGKPFNMPTNLFEENKSPKQMYKQNDSSESKDAEETPAKQPGVKFNLLDENRSNRKQKFNRKQKTNDNSSK